LQYTINYNTQQTYPSGFTSCISSCAMKHISVYSVLLLLGGMPVFYVFLTGILWSYRKNFMYYLILFKQFVKGSETQKNISSPTGRVTLTQPTNCKNKWRPSLKEIPKRKKYKWIITLGKKKVRRRINTQICQTSLICKPGSMRKTLSMFYPRKQYK